jgi:hypothetical protein
VQFPRVVVDRVHAGLRGRREAGLVPVVFMGGSTAESGSGLFSGVLVAEDSFDDFGVLG